MIELDRVVKVYGEGTPAARVALGGVSLSVGRGESVALVGPSGSGKTTLLSLVGGLTRPTSGTVVVDGRDLGSLRDVELSVFRNATVGFVFQGFHLLDHLTCLENVILPGHFFRVAMRPEVARRRGMELLERLGLSALADERPGRLSGGQRQRVAVARALFCRPRLLLCDEPTGNLDAESSDAVLDDFVRLNAEGITLLLVTHQPKVASRARRILRIEGGRLVGDGPGPGGVP